MKRTAGVDRVLAPTARMLAYAEGFRADAATCTALVGRLRKGKAILEGMDRGSESREELEELWRELVFALYAALRSAYARYALLRQMDGYAVACALWDDLMPSVEDLRALGVRALFTHFRGTMQPPQWMTPNESRCVVQMLWPPCTGQDVFDLGVGELVAEPPF